MPPAKRFAACPSPLGSRFHQNRPVMSCLLPSRLERKAAHKRARFSLPMQANLLLARTHALRVARVRVPTSSVVSPVASMVQPREWCHLAHHTLPLSGLRRNHARKDICMNNPMSPRMTYRRVLGFIDLWVMQLAEEGRCRWARAHLGSMRVTGCQTGPAPECLCPNPIDGLL